MGREKKIKLNYINDNDDDLKMEDIDQLIKFEELREDPKFPKVAERYQIFRKGVIEKEKLKKYIFNKYDITISDTSSKILTVICKIFVGEVVEKARELMSIANLEGPIKPKYYKMAYRIVSEDFKGGLFEDNPFQSLLI